ncbi:hypothetical protein SAMN04488505_104523 [Chitinophaga rupis]|uniref:Uncharacterized protein n=1 Tax=Chitinophaga rupis TaxID=573321 RepID=A0A1H7YQ18_9BACT|nr:hypothetical protein [Chitinophaga rupis]SEM48346.1 hypothetical protein SAMN04488505_104523 [Chitinophaga rupis]
MIAVNIGKTFLNAYNEKYKSNYDAKGFFVEKYFPLFFDEEKYMQWITNSPFVQGIKKGIPPSATERKQKLSVLIEKVANSAADASIAIGFPSLDMTATTSGQLTNLELPLNEKDVYLSWIGSGLGVGIQGGLSILFDTPLLLLDIFDGWGIYRDYLNRTSQLRGNQINTWNGQWIAHRYDPRLYDQQDPTAQFTGISSTKDGGLEISTQSWTAIMLGICRTFPDSQLTGYVYNLGQTNTTIGFIPFRLPQIKRPIDLYEKYFGTSQKAEAEQLFGTAFGFTKACQMGSIGIHAMEPKGLRDFIEKGKTPVYNEQDEERKLNFHTYQIWLLAMLNNEQLWESAQQFATSLNQYALSSEKGKKDKSNQVKAVLSSISQKQFLDNLTIIVEDNTIQTNYEEMARLIHMMPKDNVPYFLTLIRFHFAIISK